MVSKTKKIPEKAKLLTEKSQGEQIKYLVALVENVQGHVIAVADSLEMTRSELKEEIASGRDELKKDIAVTQMAIKAVNEDLNSQMGEVKVRLDRVEGRLDKVEERLGGVEGKMDRVVEKVENQNVEITQLKAAALEG